MADDGRWWKKDEDTDTSKKDVEEMLNEAETKRIQREEELAEAEHREKMAEFTKVTPQDDGDGVTVDFVGQRLVLKPDRHGNFHTKGRIKNVGNIDFIVDTGASLCSLSAQTARFAGLAWGEQVVTQTAGGDSIAYRTNIPNLTVGGMTINDVEGLINPKLPDDYALLGMSFLKHIEFTHDEGVLILNPDGESVGGGGSEHWLLEDPGYTIAAVVLAFGLIATAFMGVMGAGAADEWASTDAEVVNGTIWYQDIWDYEDCDDWGDCEYWTEYECGADVNYAYSVGEVDYTGEDGIDLGTWEDYCLDIVEFETLPLGSNVTIYYEINNPGNSRIDSPAVSAIFFFFCSLILLLLLAVVLVLARLDVAGPSVNFSSGGRYYDDPGYYDRPWHRRPWFHRRRHHHRHHRHHSRSRRRVGRSSSSGGSRRSSGGSRRSSGGSRRSSGGSRRSSGGRRGR
jgi:aspartyl protease family protein